MQIIDSIAKIIGYIILIPILVLTVLFILEITIGIKCRIKNEPTYYFSPIRRLGYTICDSLINLIKRKKRLLIIIFAITGFIIFSWIINKNSENADDIITVNDVSVTSIIEENISELNIPDTSIDLVQTQTSQTEIEMDDEPIEECIIKGGGYEIAVPKEWHSKDTEGFYDCMLSYSPVESKYAFYPLNNDSNNVINIGISSIDMEETDETLAYFLYCITAEEMISSIVQMADEDDTLFVDDTFTDEEATFNGYPAYSVRFSCYNDIDSVDLTMAEYSTDENGITTIVNYDFLPTVTKHDIPCWTTYYYIHNSNYFIVIEITVPKESEEYMLEAAEELISTFTLETKD